MADIIQAARWIQEGKQVTRSSWSGHLPWRESSSEGAVIVGHGFHEIAFASVYTCDLLAEDWEVTQ